MMSLTICNATVVICGEHMTKQQFTQGRIVHNAVGPHTVNNGVIHVPINTYYIKSGDVRFARNSARMHFVAICAFFNRPDVLAAIATAFGVGRAVCMFRIENIDTCDIVSDVGISAPFVNREIGNLVVYVDVVDGVAMVALECSDVW